LVEDREYVAVEVRPLLDTAKPRRTFDAVAV
jgi:hypothetical protein